MYLGRTKQPLQDRIRGHVFKRPMHRSIDINLVSKIEYAEFQTEADMYLYEIYYINTLKPPLNSDDKAKDGITVSLPDIDFKLYECPLWDSWKDEINRITNDFTLKSDRYKTIHEDINLLRSKHKMGELNEEQFTEQLDLLKEEQRGLKKFLFG